MIAQPFHMVAPPFHTNQNGTPLGKSPFLMIDISNKTAVCPACFKSFEESDTPADQQLLEHMKQGKKHRSLSRLMVWDHKNWIPEYLDWPTIIYKNFKTGNKPFIARDDIDWDKM
jgi:hypothetical protein